MLTTIKGIYEDGKIIPTEEVHLNGSRIEVLITFLTEEKKQKIFPKRVLGGLEGKISIPDDFNDPLEDLKE